MAGAGGPPPWEESAIRTAAAVFDQARQKGDAGSGPGSQVDTTEITSLPHVFWDSAEDAKQHYIDAVKSQMNGQGPEGWYDVAHWRRQRRKETRGLRRQLLGY